MKVDSLTYIDSALAGGEMAAAAEPTATEKARRDALAIAVCGL